MDNPSKAESQLHKHTRHHLIQEEDM